MKKIFLAGLVFSSLCHADVIKSTIHAIENGVIKFSNGRVAYLDGKETNLKRNDFVQMEVDGKSSLLSFKKIPAPLTFGNMSLVEAPALPYEPTVIQGGMTEAWNIFNRSNSNYKRISECSDRAHVWANDELKKNGIRSEKVFVFFTASYINRVRFKWWFHVAPLYTIADRGKVQKLVMDYRYTDRPMSVKEWTDRFVYTKDHCKVSEKFSEYDKNPQTENCYVMFRSMHYRIPADMEAEEVNGYYKTSTSESEVRSSFNFAFNK